MFNGSGRVGSGTPPQNGKKLHGREKAFQKLIQGYIRHFDLLSGPSHNQNDVNLLSSFVNKSTTKGQEGNFEIIKTDMKNI